MASELKPTTRRIELAQAIDRGEVYGYYHTGLVIWKHGVAEDCVSGRLKEFTSADPELAVWRPPADSWPYSKWPIRLTDAGREWLATNGSTE